MYSRDLVIKTHAITDKTNKSVAFFSKSLNIGDKYFDKTVPSPTNGNVRMDMNITVDYF